MMKSIVIVIITTTIYSSTETNLIFPEALLKVRVNMHYSCLDICFRLVGWVGAVPMQREGCVRECVHVYSCILKFHAVSAGLVCGYKSSTSNINYLRRTC